MHMLQMNKEVEKGFDGTDSAAPNNHGTGISPLVLRCVGFSRRSEIAIET